jgi:CheY-like chemotaxis protein
MSVQVLIQVLIADDEADFRQALTYCLEDEGYQVYEAADGVEALALLRISAAPLVVLLDYLMPRLDGQGVLAAVAQDAALAQRHAFIVCTALDRTLPPAFVELLRALGVPVVSKPFDLDALLAEVAAVGACMRAEDGA